jgi:DNA repair protein RadA/Sms
VKLCRNTCTHAAMMLRAVPRCVRAATVGRGLATKASGKLAFVCTECGMEHTKWTGQCSSCGSWNTVKEFRPAPSLASPGGIHAKLQSAGKGWGSSGGGGNELRPLSEFATQRHEGASTGRRVLTGFPEIDRVLGGGLMPGSVVLLAGAPGIGKSTFVLQLAEKLERVAFIAGEESPGQIAERAMRLAGGKVLERVDVLHETSLEASFDALLRSGLNAPYQAVVVDSIQTMYLEGLPAAAGTVTQVRECALRLLQFAKATGTPVILVGHMTKGGEVAGPRVLEHLVDTVLTLEGEGEGGTPVRVLRAGKNRFGSTTEAALLLMRESGLEVVEDPAGMFLSPTRASALEQPKGGNPMPSGSSLTATVEGRGAVCVEVEALCHSGANEWPRHRASGVSLDRLHMVLAVLAKHSKIPAGRGDVFLSVSGGLRLRDTGTEAAIAAAIASSALDLALPADLAFLGEVALSGELRSVSALDARVRALSSVGCRRVIVPADARRLDGVQHNPDGTMWVRLPGAPEALRLFPARNISQALSFAFGDAPMRSARKRLVVPRQKESLAPPEEDDERA